MRVARFIICNEFYFFTMYEGTVTDISAVGDQKMLARWNKEDPVDPYEFARNNAIEVAQGNRNPYIDFPESVDRAFEIPTE